MLKKVLLGAGILLILILAAALLIPVIYKDKIVAIVKEEVNKNINARVDFGAFDITLFRSFPDLTLQISNLNVTGVTPFEGDTLTSVEQLSVTLDIMSVIKGGQIDVESVNMDKAFINLIVLKDGRANWDIAKADSSKEESTAEASTFKVALKSYELTDSRLSYDDASLGFTLTMDALNHHGKGDFTQDLFVLSTTTGAAATNMWYGGVKYMHQVKTVLKADLDMNMPDMKFTFRDNELQLNELFIGMDGWLAMPAEDINMDLKFSARKNEFKNFLSMIPGVYREGFKDLKSSGTLELKAFVKGTYSDKQMPGFGADLKVNNGHFQYPSLPVAVNNVQLQLKINNPDGIPDHTFIDLNQLHVELGKEPFDASFSVRSPVSDADIKGAVRGTVNLSNINKIIPLEAGTSLRGRLQADLTMAGRMSAIEQKQYENFKASGSLALNDFNYSSRDYKQGFELTSCRLDFNPQHVELTNFDARSGKSDIQANGKLDNLLAYYFKKETLKGSLNLMSNHLDLSEFSGGEEEKAVATTDTTAMTLIEIPENIDFTVKTAIGKLNYDNVTLENMSGSVVIREQSLNMENLSFTTLGGAMKLSGSYATRERKNADISLNMDISGFDIQQTVTTFNTVKKMAPIAERANGRFSSDFSMTGKLDEHMQPLMNSLQGNGKLSTANVTISNFSPLVKVAEVLRMDRFRELNVSNVNISFSFVNGRISYKPFDVVLEGIPTNVSGSTGFDQSIDFTLAMNAPVSKLPSAATGVISGLISKANAKGANFSMSENVKLNVLIGGTVTKPTVSTDIKQTTGNLIQAASDKAKEEIEKKKKELEEKAKAEAERLKKEAEDKARQEAEKLKKEAEERAKKEKEKLKKEAEQKAKDALKDLFGPKK